MNFLFDCRYDGNNVLALSDLSRFNTVMESIFFKLLRYENLFVDWIGEWSDDQ